MGRRYDVNLNDFYFIGDTSQFQNIFERYLLTFKKQKNVTLKKNKRKKEGRGEREEGWTNQINLVHALLEDS